MKQEQVLRDKTTVASYTSSSATEQLTTPSVGGVAVAVAVPSKSDTDTAATASFYNCRNTRTCMGRSDSCRLQSQ